MGIIPDAGQCISYGMPAFKLNGKTVAGFAAFKNDLSYLPHSSSVLTELGDDLAGYVATKGSLHFPVDTPLPKELVAKLIAVHLRQLRPHSRMELPLTVVPPGAGRRKWPDQLSETQPATVSGA